MMRWADRKTCGIIRHSPHDAVDAQEKITYDGSGMDEDQLRTAIAKLGPEYAALSPKPKQTPCTASK